jgi:rhodanese-related sulfurtransferase
MKARGSEMASAGAVAAVAVLMCSVVVELHTAAQNTFGEATHAPQPQLQPHPQPQQSQSAPQPQTQQPITAPAQQSPSSGGALDALMVAERQDFGIAPVSALHDGAMHGPTPASIPGGQVITTKGLVELIRGGKVPVLTLDVLGGSEMIQGAVYAVPASQPGTFNDQTQQQFGQFLQQATGGNKEHPIVLYCLSPECWMSYNASLRAINLGYTNVLWYRGGIESWKKAGLPVQRSTR